MISKDQYEKKPKKRRLRKGVAAVFVVAVLILFGVLFQIFKPNKTEVSSSAASASLNLQSSEKNQESSSIKENVKTTKTVPVLMYHSIATEKGNILRVPKENFDKEMKWLSENGYKTMTISDAYNAVSQKKEIPEKSVLITFDDGYIDNYDNAFPIMKKYGLKGTVFMITSEIGDSKNGYLTAEQLKEMDSNGMEIESHTVTHSDLDSLSYSKQLKELEDSKSALETLLGRDVDYLAFPTGKYNDDTIKAAKEAGYKMCFKMKGGQGTINDDIYAFPRFFVGEDFEDFVSRVEGTAEYSK